MPTVVPFPQPRNAFTSNGGANVHSVARIYPFRREAIDLKRLEMASLELVAPNAYQHSYSPLFFSQEISKEFTQLFCQYAVDAMGAHEVSARFLLDSYFLGELTLHRLLNDLPFYRVSERSEPVMLPQCEQAAFICLSVLHLTKLPSSLICRRCWLLLAEIAPTALLTAVQRISQHYPVSDAQMTETGLTALQWSMIRYQKQSSESVPEQLLDLAKRIPSVKPRWRAMLNHLNKGETDQRYQDFLGRAQTLPSAHQCALAEKLAEYPLATAYKKALIYHAVMAHIEHNKQTITAWFDGYLTQQYQMDFYTSLQPRCALPPITHLAEDWPVNIVLVHRGTLGRRVVGPNGVQNCNDHVALFEVRAQDPTYVDFLCSALIKQHKYAKQCRLKLARKVVESIWRGDSNADHLKALQLQIKQKQLACYGETTIRLEQLLPLLTPQQRETLNFYFPQ